MRLIDADDLEKLFREVIGRLAKEPVIGVHDSSKRNDNRND